MSPAAYALLGLTAVVAALVGIVVYALLRFTAAAREARLLASTGAAEGTLLTSALQDAVAQLRGKQRQLQARAEASERLSSEIVLSLSSGLLLIDAAGQVQLVNPAAARLLGLDAGQAHYSKVLARVPPLRDAVANALAGRGPISRQTLRLEPGPVTHIGLTTSPIHDAHGNLSSVIFIFTDLTEVAALEEQMRLKDSLARLGEWAASIAHEFRNSLATIHGYARLLSTDRLSTEDATCVRGIRSETEALGTVVSSFLEFARPAPLRLARVDFAALVARVVADAQADAVGSGGVVRLAGEFPPVEGDEVLLRQALSNLLRNSLQACTDAAIVPAITVHGDSVNDAWCRVTVTDNGPGVPPDKLSKIFQPFVTTKAQGTGLGLAIVQKIVVMHNGRVTAMNNAGGGASFEIILPVKQHDTGES